MLCGDEGEEINSVGRLFGLKDSLILILIVGNSVGRSVGRSVSRSVGRLVEEIADALRR